MTSPGLRPAIPPISQQKLPLRHHVTWACVVSPPATADQAGTWQHVRRAGLPQNPPTQLGSRAEKSSGRYGPPPPAPQVVDTQSQSGGLDKNQQRAGQNQPDCVILCGFQLNLWCTVGAIDEQKGSTVGR
jgi:hypothetical protein